MTEKKKAQEVVEKDIADRLAKIGFHFEERHRARAELEKFTAADTSPGAVPNAQLERVLPRLKSEEMTALHELVHLLDNVRVYFDIRQLKTSELAVVEMFRLYRVAANYVNTLKHGTRGRNKDSAKADYFAFIYDAGPADKTSGETSITRIIDARWLVNFEGDMYDSHQMIADLIGLWALFLRYHTEVDAKPLARLIDTMRATRQALSTYSLPLPEAIRLDAKTQADQRRHLDL